MSSAGGGRKDTIRKTKYARAILVLTLYVRSEGAVITTLTLQPRTKAGENSNHQL